MEIISNDHLVLREVDGNPIAPDGWWEAVSKLDDRCYVVVAESGSIDLHDKQNRLQQLMDLKGSPRAAAAVLPVES
ncbi:hypothetical protein [Cryobacterium sp. TMT4-31]|uniref:hypothetical protein n=1 Tax=Cryobacterium sp. TMT4-31 TaxID=1259259 RepID=UPI00106BEFA8|nr:hypothetical protein [Cryobacterium sp. TMT4-31]TFC87678.1 hypothetical protein E3T19_11765 [Cryobacterium sp. TMT4-31]